LVLLAGNWPWEKEEVKMRKCVHPTQKDEGIKTKDLLVYQTKGFPRGETHLFYLLHVEVLQVLATMLEKYF
jgi:hypothetical protein